MLQNFLMIESSILGSTNAHAAKHTATPAGPTSAHSTPAPAHNSIFRGFSASCVMVLTALHAMSLTSMPPGPQVASKCWQSGHPA